MTPYAGVSARSTNSNHLNNGLLFQFILADFLIAFDYMQILDSLCQQKPLPTEEAAFLVYNQGVLKKIETNLTQLIGTQGDTIKRFSTSFNEGVLTKLKAYCTIFFQQADNEEKELIAMHYYAEKSWLHCLQANEALSDTSKRHPQLFTHLEKANQALSRFSKLIVRVIPQFRDDENVLFFVLRHHSQFDKLYGRKFTTKLFCRMYTKGMPEAQHFLTKKYLERRFDTIPNLIATLFADLEAAS